jgi:D-galacturonate reductase
MVSVGVIGGGMIVHDQILPSLYQLQRHGIVDRIQICARNESTLAVLKANAKINTAFPAATFEAKPGHYSQVLEQLPPRSIVIVALPDQIHFEVTMDVLRAGHHVICVKPLVLKTEDSLTIEHEAATRELLVAVEYHKRFDDRSLMARKRYRDGLFGDFKLGNAWLHEKWDYRGSNFQNTGLNPSSVSVYGIKDTFPNGNVGYLWADARVIWENGACLNVQNALGYPQNGPGSNAQGIVMYCSGKGEGAMIRHSDQYRGLEYCYYDRYEEPSPDYFQYVDLGGPGLTPVGYGYRSIDQLIAACLSVDAAQDRLERIVEIDAAGIIATPANSRYNELVVEAGRLSLLNQGREALIDHKTNSVHLR